MLINLAAVSSGREEIGDVEPVGCVYAIAQAASAGRVRDVEAWVIASALPPDAANAGIARDGDGSDCHGFARGLVSGVCEALDRMPPVED